MLTNLYRAFIWTFIFYVFLVVLAFVYGWVYEPFFSFAMFFVIWMIVFALYEG